MSNIGLYEGPSYYEGAVVSEDSRRAEASVYNNIEDLLVDEEEALVEHIWAEINDMLAHYQHQKYNRRAP